MGGKKLIMALITLTSEPQLLVLFFQAADITISAVRGSSATVVLMGRQGCGSQDQEKHREKR